MNTASYELKLKIKKMKKNFFIFKLLSLTLLLAPAAQAVDLVFDGVDSSLFLSEPGGIYDSSLNLAVTAQIDPSDTDFFNFNCNINGELLLTSPSATENQDYQIDSTTFTITTTPAEVSSGQVFSSADNFLTILSDTEEESAENLVIAMRNISILCNQNNVPVRNTQVLNINIVDAEQEGTEVPLEDRDSLREVGQGTLVSQVEDIKTFSLMSSATRVRGLTKQIHRSRQRTQTIDTSNLTVSLNGIALDCRSLPALCQYNLNNVSESSSSTNQISPIGFFVNGSIELGERKDETESRIEFDSDFLSVGADYRYSDQVVLGVAVSRSTTESGAKDRTSSTDYEQYGLSFFGSYYFSSQYYIDFIASYGKSDYDLLRRVELGTVTGFARGDTDGEETNFALSSGYTFNWDNMELRLSGVLNYADVSVDGYLEESFGAIPTVEVAPLDVDQLLSNIAADLTWTVNTSFGVVIPQLSLGWEHHYSKDTYNVSGALSANNNSDDFSYVSQAQDKDYATWLVGVSSVLTNGATLYSTIEGYAGRSDISATTAYIGFRLEF